MKNFNSEFEKQERTFNRMFKIVLGFIIFVFCVIIAGWVGVGFLVATKGPETVHRVERVIDAYTDKLEQENKKSE